MNERSDEQARQSAAEDEFLGRLSEHYVPPPLTAARRAALDRELRDRIAAPRGIAVARPAFALAAVAAVFGLSLAFGAFDSLRRLENADPGITVADSASDAAWEQSLFDPESFEEEDAGNDMDGLPDDYAAIAGILLDG